MKKTLIFGIIVGFALSLAPAHAQIATDLTASATGSVVATEAPLTLTARKTKAETELRALESQFRLFVTRTQLTIDRLATKGVDTTSAQTQLSSSLTALNTAKTDLEFFATIIVTDDMDEKAIEKSGLKPALVNIQDSLKVARTHLIESLTTLKTNVSLTQ
jgi:hypothetical protein